MWCSALIASVSWNEIQSAHFIKLLPNNCSVLVSFIFTVPYPDLFESGWDSKTFFCSILSSFLYSATRSDEVSFTPNYIYAAYLLDKNCFNATSNWDRLTQMHAHGVAEVRKKNKSDKTNRCTNGRSLQGYWACLGFCRQFFAKFTISQQAESCLPHRTQ